MKYIAADETSVQVLREVGKAASSKSYMWVYKSGRYLQGYTGILQSDGYQAYDKIQGAEQMWYYVKISDTLNVRN